MAAMTLDSAKNIGIAVAVGLIALMFAMAIVIKNITTKLISILLIGGLAFGVWTQRSSLQDCADRVKERGLAVGSADVTCTSLGSDVKISPGGS
jgi:hypothetical protein